MLGGVHRPLLIYVVSESITFERINMCTEFVDRNKCYIFVSQVSFGGQDLVEVNISRYELVSEPKKVAIRGCHVFLHLLFSCFICILNVLQLSTTS